MVTETIEQILEDIKKFKDKRDQLHELTYRIYWAIPKMFKCGIFQPGGIEIHHGGTYAETKKIYMWDLAENLARKFLGMEIRKIGGEGETWEDARRQY